MIADHSRAGWFGASDTAYVMGNWKTKSFQKWWLQKLGIHDSRFTSTAMNAGTYFEHSVLDAVGVPRKDYQILIPELLLRVNLDGDGPGRIWECKTHKVERPYKPTKAHIGQVQVQMFAKYSEEGRIPKAEIVSYGLTDEDYRNFFKEIDAARLRTHPVAYNPAFIDGYLRRLKYLRDCLTKGVFPDEIPR